MSLKVVFRKQSYHDTARNLSVLSKAYLCRFGKGVKLILSQS